MKKQIITSIACMAVALNIVAKDEVKSQSHLSWKTIPVAENLYMLIGEGGFTGGNLGLSVGEDGVILIDDAMPSTLNIMNDAIKGITEDDIDFLINTHVHGDHTGNNTTFGEKGAHIVSHKNMRKHLLTKGIATPDGNIPAPKEAIPVISFSDSIDFHLNSHEAHVFHLPHAHTDGDSAVHFTNINAIHMGDTFFNKIFPFIDYTSGGTLDGYIEAQKTVLALVDDETKIIPGHGPLATKQDLIESINMLEDAKSIISKLIDEGKSEDEIINMNPLKEKYQSWHWGFITIQKMTKQIYQGLKMTSI